MNIVTAKIRKPNRIFYSNSELTFSQQVELDTFSDATYSLDVGDYDNDGGIDILIGL